MRCADINIRDPFVLFEDGKYYMYGTRAKNFGKAVGGFDVYVSEDLENWSDPIACFDSEANGMNFDANWAPEVHKYRGKYYMFATFTRKSNGLRATFILKADSPLGPFVPHSDGEVTPKDWECLDGTFYVDECGKPYMVFCHEHTQIIDGSICYLPLSDDLRSAVAEPILLFHASEPYWISEKKDGVHYVTDGPFLHRLESGELYMIWSTFIGGKYAECLVRFEGGRLGTSFTHMPPLMSDDGGHGMIFRGADGLYLTLHSPNKGGLERPCFTRIVETDGKIIVADK